MIDETNVTERGGGVMDFVCVDGYAWDGKQCVSSGQSIEAASSKADLPACQSDWLGAVVLLGLLVFVVLLTFVVLAVRRAR